MPPILRPGSPILRIGETCWRIERAHRFALIVDADDYFAHAKAAMLAARHSIYLIGWDFDLRIRLGSDEDGPDGAEPLGHFLRRIVSRNENLHVYILEWDTEALDTLGRQMLPLLAHNLVAPGRMHFRLDSVHPLTSAQHQKIAVIDDALAFCGGIDMTTDRWDTRAHLPDDPRRVGPDGDRYGPWHDATAAVDGDAARALGRLARERWERATGHRPRVPPAAVSEPWPDGLEPQLRDIDVAIARTFPAYHGRPQVAEVEHLYLEAIRQARRTVYLESQYFASVRIAAALARRLREPDGPEVVVVNPCHTTGWLEEETMGAARDVLLHRVAEADRHGRFRIYCPVNEAGEPVYVHAKVAVIDDRLLRVGSSNLNNRSLGFDSECDLALEADPGRPEIAATITRIRDDLLAEHLGVPQSVLADAIRHQGGLGAAIESLRRPQGRSLRPLAPGHVNPAEAAIVESELADPERPEDPEGRLEHAVKRAVLRVPPPVWLGLAAALLAGTAATFAAGRAGRREDGRAEDGPG